MITFSLSKSYTEVTLHKATSEVSTSSPFFDGKEQLNRTYTDRDFISPITVKAACDWHYGKLSRPKDIKLFPLVIENLENGQSIFLTMI
jgi:hypothetical protein